VRGLTGGSWDDAVEQEAPGNTWAGQVEFIPAVEAGQEGAPSLNLPLSFLPCLQNSDGHSFLTEEELLQRCAQKAPKVNTQVGEDRWSSWQ
jgi:hypothetical protein